MIDLCRLRKKRVVSATGMLFLLPYGIRLNKFFKEQFSSTY